MSCVSATSQYLSAISRGHVQVTSLSLGLAWLTVHVLVSLCSSFWAQCFLGKRKYDITYLYCHSTVHPHIAYRPHTYRTELIRRMRRFQVANYACLIVKYAKDDRYSNQDVSTHDRQMTHGIAATLLRDIKSQAHKFNVIGIDEGQFFPDIVDFCEEMANAGKTVIVAALDGTFQRKVCVCNSLIHLL